MLQENKIKAVLFDMDGVLLDSEKYICQAGIEMFKEKGFLVAAKDFLPFTGMGENRYLGGVAEIHNIPFQLEKDKARTYEIYASLVKSKLKPLEGVEEFIAKCLEKKLKIAVASSADRIKIEINLKEIGIREEIFHAIVSGLDVKNKKPAPDIFLKAAQMVDTSASNCLVVEDAISGVSAAKSAGARVLGLTTSFSAEEMSEADWISTNLSTAKDEVLDW
ncbi:MAG: HAD-IA family hydrolase [Bacteroidales bacterium]|nr:HAD-IA family hydrolase [Bacteroidales bacterium]MCF8391030.1 HAD-IA family hydrolase [Bacteroidales bacterium]